MSFNFTKINGTNSKLDYDYFKTSISKELGFSANEVEVLVLNTFPVPVSSKNSLDLLLFVKNNNPFKKIEIHQKNNVVYLSNLIIAISIIDDYFLQNIATDNSNNIETENYHFDLVEDASKLKWGLTNYLANTLDLERKKITVHPIFWIKNQMTEKVIENVIISSNLNFKDILSCIGYNEYLRYPGYIEWNNDATYNYTIQQLFEVASKDSDLGYITKNKIVRLQNKFEEASIKAFDEIGFKLVEVKGKAGTGKSSDLIKWMLNRSLTGERATFLTYNHLLVYDITRLVRLFENNLKNHIDSKASTSVNTIHSFMYNVAKKLGVTLLMSEERFTELKTKLDVRFTIIKEEYLIFLKTENIITINSLKNFFQNNVRLDLGSKREAIDFLIKYSVLDIKNEIDFDNKLESFKRFKVKVLQEEINSSMFLMDYHGVLKNIMLALSDLNGFINKYDLTNKYDLLEIPLRLNESVLNDTSTKEINRDKIFNRYSKSINHFSARRKLYIDEGQDCHPLERDVFFKIFGSNNIIISSGGKEQLIRYSQVCNWEITQNKSIDIYRYNKRRKSYRLKPAIAALVNFIGEYFGIDTGIEPLDTEDHGTIIVDKSGNNDSKKLAIANSLLLNSERNGCTVYESLLLLSNANDTRNNNSSVVLNNVSKTLTVNEDDVIYVKTKSSRNEWKIANLIEANFKDLRVWNATGNVEKKEQSIPGSLSLRLIYYESCRGLESWATMCFDLDGFFETKRNEEDADNFLLTEIMDNETRKNKYAATWIIMALTRAIDTSYIEINNDGSILAKCINDFISKNPQYVEVIN
jgi:hypothetical protein